MSSKEEFHDSYATFFLQDELGCIQFLNYDHKTWFFDIPVYDNDDFINQALNIEISRELVFKIVKEFLSRGSFFQYVMSKNYHAIIQLLKELWVINIVLSLMEW